MSTSWVAASVRGRALARRRVGPAGARRLAASTTLTEAITALAETPYGHDVRAVDSLAQAQHHVAASVLWNLRVLGGWAPRSGVASLRALAAAFEIANTDEHLQMLRGRSAGPTFRLGSFATAWPRIVATTSRRELVDVLTASSWGDPGSEGVHAIRLYMRMSWIARIIRVLPMAQTWVAGAGALLVARETVAADRAVPEPVVRAAEPVLGAAWVRARNPAQLIDALPPYARWALRGVRTPADVWRAEAAWWRRLEDDAFALLRRSSFDLDPAVAALALLAVDAWRVQAALEAAAGHRNDLELFDAVA